MKQTFEVKNVKCGGCASTPKKDLLEEFGEVEVDLEVEPRKITLEMEEKDEESLKLKLRKLGYPLVSDELSAFSTVSTTAKSFVSCAIGKIDNMDKDK
jgi:copper chaperone CopZ